MSRIPIDIVLFDLGNTLIYFDGVWVPDILQEGDRAMLSYFHGVGLSLDENLFIPEFERRLLEYYEQRESDLIEQTTASVVYQLLVDIGYPSIPPEIAKKGVEVMYSTSRQYWQPEINTVSTLQALKERGYRLGIISNAGDHEDVQALVDKAQVRPYFDIILTSAREGIRKPNPRIFYNALAHWQAVPAQAAMVGDLLNADILGARNAGLFSIWITRRANTLAQKTNTPEIHPDAVIADLDDLLPLLETQARPV